MGRGDKEDDDHHRIPMRLSRSGKMMMKPRGKEDCLKKTNFSPQSTVTRLPLALLCAASCHARRGPGGAASGCTRSV